MLANEYLYLYVKDYNRITAKINNVIYTKPRQVHNQSLPIKNIRFPIDTEFHFNFYVILINPTQTSFVSLVPLIYSADEGINV